MNLNEAKIAIDEALKRAEAQLDIPGLKLTREIEVAENELNDGTTEALMVLGSLAISAEGLTEDDTYYLSIDAKVNAGEVDEALLGKSVAALPERVNAIKARLAEADDVAEAVKAMGLEVDEELETKFREELAREHGAVKRDLKLAIFATAAMLLVAVVFVIVSTLLK